MSCIALGVVTLFGLKGRIFALYELGLHCNWSQNRITARFTCCATAHRNYKRRQRSQGKCMPNYPQAYYNSWALSKPTSRVRILYVGYFNQIAGFVNLGTVLYHLETVSISWKHQLASRFPAVGNGFKMETVSISWRHQLACRFPSVVNDFIRWKRFH